MQPNLFSRFNIGPMQLKNKIVMPPMLTQHAGSKGHVTEQTKNYFEARARGGAGLIIVGSCYIHDDARVFENMLGISHDDYIPGLQELVNVIHAHGAKAAVQLEHGGKYSIRNPVAPSPIQGGSGSHIRVLSREDMPNIADTFAEAAKRAKKAGFDGIEIHGAHGYLLAQFLSRAWNKRDDLYGGTLRNRARLLNETIMAVKFALGEKFPIWCRINGKEYGVKDGLTVEEAAEIAKLAEEAGSMAIHVSAFAPESPGNDPIYFKVIESFKSLKDDRHFPTAVISDLSGQIRKAVSVPVIIAGRVSLEAAETVLTEGKADLISIGKGLLADPELPNKAYSGRADDIKPCMLCLTCRNELFKNSPGNNGIICSVNPALGAEKKYEISAIKHKPSKILVIGGGPAGMEAARVAALRGHHVILFERQFRLGGQLNYAMIPPYKDGIKYLNAFLQKQMYKLGVEQFVGKEINAERIGEIKPDKIIVATGAKPIIPGIPGAKGQNVLTAFEALSMKKEIGKEVIIIGGGWIGCETAEFLALGGKEVTIIEQLEQIGLEMLPLMKNFILKRMSQLGIKMRAKTKAVTLSNGGVEAVLDGKSSKFLKADSVVLAVGMVPDNNFISLKSIIAEIHLIGDCVRPRSIRDSIMEGYIAGLKA